MTAEFGGTSSGVAGGSSLAASSVLFAGTSLAEGSPVVPMQGTQFLLASDLDRLVGAAMIDQFLDDDGDGKRDWAALTDIMVQAEDVIASELLRGWPSREAVNELCRNDRALRGQAAWIAIELASERKREFLAADGKGRYWTQYERAIEYARSVSKSQKQSVGEQKAGRNKQTGGVVNPPRTTADEPRFVFAPDKRSPKGHGGFVLPLFFLIEIVHRAMVLSA